MKAVLSALRILTGCLLLAASAALAHQGVQNAAVMARMHAMGLIKDNTKVLGEMAKGQVAFDAEAARQAALQIALQADQVPQLFEAQEDDPKSEALPEIWQNFPDFAAQSRALAAAANKAAQQISVPDDLPVALGAIGETCKSCHKTYRE